MLTVRCVPGRAAAAGRRDDGVRPGPANRQRRPTLQPLLSLRKRCQSELLLYFIGNGDILKR